MDLINRQDAIRIVDSIDTWQAGWRGNAIERMKLLIPQPEIIRCKDCIHYRAYAGIIDGYCYMAEWYKRYQYENDFCSRAERREDDEVGS